jgi:hypothetical protein
VRNLLLCNESENALSPKGETLESSIHLPTRAVALPILGVDRPYRPGPGPSSRTGFGVGALRHGGGVPGQFTFGERNGIDTGRDNGPGSGMAKPLERPVETHPAMVAPSPTTVPVDPVVEPADLVASELPPLPVPPELSTPAEEVVQLAQARVPNDVLLAYIEGATSPFELGADEILYLTDLGVPAETIAVMVRRDQELKEQPGGTVAATALAIPAATAEVGEAARVEHGEPPVVAANGLPAAFAVTPTAETAPTEPVQPVHQVTHNYFYNALSPYGSWRESPDHGWVWQPSVAVVEPDWRPYLHGGRWIWTDHGWYWHSFYSWGWAPFHYGRWHRSASVGLGVDAWHRMGSRLGDLAVL